MRYDWSRAGSPWSARVARACMWCMTFCALIACPLLLWESATMDWTLTFPALLVGGGAVAQRLVVRKVYGVREVRPAVPAKTLAEQVAEAVEAQRQAKWDRVAEQAFQARPPDPARPVAVPRHHPPAGALDLRAWLSAAADEVARTGARDPGLVLPVGVMSLESALRALPSGRLQKQRYEVTLTARLSDGGFLTESRRGSGAAPLGAVFAAGTEQARIPPPVPKPSPGPDPAHDLYAAQVAALVGSCPHREAVPVDLATGETVAYLCPDCEAQLPAKWR